MRQFPDPASEAILAARLGDPARILGRSVNLQRYSKHNQLPTHTGSSSLSRPSEDMSCCMQERCKKEEEASRLEVDYRDHQLQCKNRHVEPFEKIACILMRRSPLVRSRRTCRQDETSAPSVSEPSPIGRRKNPEGAGP